MTDDRIFTNSLTDELTVEVSKAYTCSNKRRQWP